MLKRLLVGFLEGGLVGALVAFLLARLAFSWDAPFVVYGAAVVVGVVTGLVAGRPIWAKAAKTEAGIKAVVGAFIAAVTMFGVRKWLPNVTVDLSRLGGGTGSLGSVPFAALPTVGAALALVFEIDHAAGGDETLPHHRVSADASRSDEEEALEESPEARRERRRG